MTKLSENRILTQEQLSKVRYMLSLSMDAFTHYINAKKITRMHK